MVNMIFDTVDKMACIAAAGTLDLLAEARGRHFARDFVVWDFNDHAGNKRFLAFESARCFYEFLMSLSPSKRTLCETIREETQKPRFDVDIETEKLPIMRKPEGVLDELCFAILSTFEQVRLSDIQVYTSHSDNGEKYSYHIVLNNWYHKSSQEASTAYQEVVSHMPPDLARFVDGTVYKSPCQQFRMLYNSKPGEYRFKIRDRSWKYFGEHPTPSEPDRSEEDEFYSSLITLVEGCKHLVIPKLNESASISKEYLASEDADYDQLVSLVPKGYRLDPKKKSYGYRLKRVSPSYCEICKRKHGTNSKGDNARIFIKGGAIYLCCFRDQEKRRHLLDTINDEQPTVQEEATELCKLGPVPEAEASQPRLKFDEVMTIISEQQNRLSDRVTSSAGTKEDATHKAKARLNFDDMMMILNQQRIVQI